MEKKLVNALNQQLRQSETYKQGTNIKYNTNLLIQNIYQLLNNYQPIIGPITNSLFLAPCQLAKLNALIMCNPAGFINNNMKGLVNILQGGNNYHINQNKCKIFRKIYDNRLKKSVLTNSERGKEILIGYLGYLFIHLL